MSELSADAARGARAKAVLESDIYREAHASVRQALLDKWEASPIRDVEGQHELKLMLKLLREVEKFMQEAVTSGKLAEIQLERENTLRARARKLFRAT